jgi:putative peptidoglycan lipid II flippase
MALRGSVVALVYERGSFNAVDAAHTATALLGYAPQLPFVAASQMLMLVSFARRDTRVPAAVSAAGVGAYVVLALILLPRLTILGLALANTGALALQTVALAGLLLLRMPRFSWRRIAAQSARLVAAGLAMTATLAAVSHLVGTRGGNWESHGAGIVIPGLLGLIVYAAALLPWPSLRSLRVPSVTRDRTS